MLEKIPGCRDVRKICAILLMDANFNFTNKLFYGNHMMEWAEAHGEAPQECFGGQTNHQAINNALCRCPSLNTTCQTQISASIASVDTEQCFDRMDHSIGSIFGHHLRLQIKVITLMLLTIQLMQFFLCTAFSYSTHSYGGSLAHPFMGACQGHGGAGGFWFSISIVIIKMMHIQGHVAIIVCTILSFCVECTGFLFINNTNLVNFAILLNEPTKWIVNQPWRQYLHVMED